ncbi:aa3-type cytochrome c oxidase subunit IV [Phenylobacterium sp.]|jgi:integral membrane sensor domain MASE1|uniref:aa3-type cytochrome c oxidase subunit IV n=1 Tax=Phenylobacterium sp. TaxID=1871053 RepID=UPI002F3ECA2F
MAGPASNYQRGEMDIQEQVSTFELVMHMTKWGSLAVTSMLVLLVLWFCTGVGFFTAALTSAVVATLGVIFLRNGAGAEH